MNNERVKKHRAQKRMLTEQNVTETSGYESVEPSTSGQQRLIVKFPCEKRKGPRRRVSRELRKTKRQVVTLSRKVDVLRKKYKTSLRALNRLKNKIPKLQNPVVRIRQRLLEAKLACR